ncbi:MAG: hypothetical protein PVH88_00135 [Ignavibacteria bacterium]|jgi:hypothetical protein
MLYDFKDGVGEWEPAGSNVEGVYATSSGSSIAAFSENYLFLETNATNAPSDYRAAQITTDGLDLSNNYLVGAAYTWGIAEPNNFTLKVKVWGPTDADTMSATALIHADNWYFFRLNLSDWEYASSVTKLWIGIANSDTASSLPTAWTGKCAFDEIALESKLEGGSTIIPAYKGTLSIT